ncbi:MAG TPA: glycosyltransferase family 4 protein [Smithella sp.]|nr:glycosyltransferase family 4 protein [Smithella sp.]
MVKDSKKHRLLFISPIVPSPDGPGLAMRPFYQIVNLSRIYSIHLLVAGAAFENPLYGDNIKKYCDAIDYICCFPYWGWKYGLWFRYRLWSDRFKQFACGTSPCFAADLADGEYLMHNKILKTRAKMNFDRVQVFRLYLTPVAEVLKNLGLRSFYSIDVDDIESETRRSISGLHFRNRDFIKASMLNNESKVFFNIETQSIPGYDQIFTCSQRDKDYLQNRFPDKVITVLPNVVPVPQKERNRQAHKIFTMLFVGNLNYYPNIDALLFFADQIVPVLRKNCKRQWNLRVVGALPEKAWVKILKKIPEMEFAGPVKNLHPEYDAADIVVAPIRGGGGTRIKILEAFAHGVPVVSTSKGAEGLDVENRVHLFIEDDARLFAQACEKLMTDSTLGDELSRRALSLADSKYSPEMTNRVWMEPLPCE